MNEKIAKVFNGWIELSDQERMQFDSAVRDYVRESAEGKRRVRESVRKTAEYRIETGPLGRGCPCCGR